MSIARTDDRAPARDSSIIGGISVAAVTLLAIGGALVRLRRRGERTPSELPLSPHLRRDIGLPIEPTRHGWREG